MKIELNRGGCSAVLDTFGGELVSYKDKNGTEYIWHGDPAFWSGRNPVLFPVVGALKDNKTRIGHEEYEMPPHGFARRMEFSVAESSGSHAVFELRDDENTRRAYPFSFSLKIRHELTENGFETTFIVENKSDVIMPFCIGAHTAFNCPLYGGEAFEDYVVRFDNVENLPSRVAEQKLIHPVKTFACLENSDTIPLRYKVFDEYDTIILEGLSSSAASLINPATGRGVRMEFAGFPMFAIWTMPNKNAPYVCLEPWHGCAAIADESGRFEDKPYSIRLMPAEKSVLGYKVSALM